MVQSIFHFTEDEISKLSLLEIARKLVLNVISIDEKIFKYTCNEAGIRCNPDMHTRSLMGYIQEIEKKIGCPISLFLDENLHELNYKIFFKFIQFCSAALLY